MSDAPAGTADPPGPGPEHAVVRLAAALDDRGGAPVLVLGNSLGTTSMMWAPQVAAFRRHFRLLRYEHRGHGRADGLVPGGSAGSPGRSPAPPGPYTIAELGADVLALLDSYRVDRAWYCGVSLGGMVGMWLAVNAPERIAGLALCCTSAYLPPVSLWTARAEQARSGGMAGLAEQVVSRWFTPVFRRASPAVPAAFVTELAATDPEGYAGCCEAVAAMDLRPSLTSITAPTLVLAAAEDPATPPWHGAVIASAIPGARLTVIRGAAHLANISASGEVTAALLSQLSSRLGDRNGHEDIER